MSEFYGLKGGREYEEGEYRIVVIFVSVFVFVGFYSLIF